MGKAAQVALVLWLSGVERYAQAQFEERHRAFEKASQLVRCCGCCICTMFSMSSMTFALWNQSDGRKTCMCFKQVGKYWLGGLLVKNIDGMIEELVGAMDERLSRHPRHRGLRV
eukprot:TRINITY_DN936_c0_g1_i4.p1 TRINITY_DN936_c0_g1~~TRINITY_DN936_c0_g1_i4.p1  ORF type:complete len:114 (+),score=19.66 TRINITY_DN936_c0_g1_i4:125-466(+)